MSSEIQESPQAAQDVSTEVTPSAVPTTIAEVREINNTTAQVSDATLSQFPSVQFDEEKGVLSFDGGSGGGGQSGGTSIMDEGRQEPGDPEPPPLEPEDTPPGTGDRERTPPQPGEGEQPENPGDRSVERPAQDPEEQRLKELDKQYGVGHETRTDANGKTTTSFFVVNDKGERVPVLETDKPADQAGAELEKWRDQKTAELEKNYNLNISGDNDVVDGRQMRKPTLLELKTLENALQQSQPSQLVNGGKPLDVNFTRQKREGDPPGFATPGAIFITDTPQDWNDLNSIFQHELAHNGQFNMNDAQFRDYAKEMGYVQDKKGDWLLQGKNGEFYKKDNTNEKNEWVLVDRNGMPIRDPETKQEIRYKNEDVAERALIKPASLYFLNPWEGGAEAALHFRGSEQQRSQLYRNSPQLYEATKRADQSEIDRAYGVNPDGSSKYLRGSDGKVVQNTAENRERIQQFENGLKKPQSKPDREDGAGMRDGASQEGVHEETGQDGALPQNADQRQPTKMNIYERTNPPSTIEMQQRK